MNEPAPKGPRSLSAALSLPLMALGYLAMISLQFFPALGAFLGLKLALLTSETALVLPALAGCLLGGVGGDGLALRTISPRQTALSLLSGIAFWVLSLGLLDLQYAFWRPPTEYLEAFRHLHEALWSKDVLDWCFSLLAIALAPACFEELLFRGIVLPSLVRPLGVVAAVLLSAAFFGAIHVDLFFAFSGILKLDGSLLLGSFYRVPFALAVGLGLGTLRVRSGSLLPSTLAHALLNATTFVAEGMVKDPQMSEEPAPFLGAALLLAGCVAAGVLLRRIDSPRAPS